MIFSKTLQYYLPVMTDFKFFMKINQVQCSTALFITRYINYLYSMMHFNTLVLWIQKSILKQVYYI